MICGDVAIVMMSGGEIKSRDERPGRGAMEMVERMDGCCAAVLLACWRNHRITIRMQLEGTYARFFDSRLEGFNEPNGQRHR